MSRAGPPGPSGRNRARGRRSRALLAWRRPVGRLLPLLLVLAGCGGAAAPRAAAPAPDLSRCADTACFARELRAIVDAARDPSAAVDGITAAAYADPGGLLLRNCHGLMHTVGREYAARRHVTLANLMTVLPRSNDPACAGGFAHGVVTGVAPEIERAGPAQAQHVCASAGTRFQRYSCTHGFGHAFMRLNQDQIVPALKLCAQLGPQYAPDCAQGAYHDHWFALKGADGTRAPAGAVTDPKTLCAQAPAEFVRACWYRAFVELADGNPVSSAADIRQLCGGDLRGLQRQGCITGAAVIGPGDPREQLAICRDMAAADVTSCIRGTKVQDMLAYSPRIYPILIGDCGRFRGAGAASCYRWLGTALGVLTDGKFAQTGCPTLPNPGRRECAAGVKAMEGPLVTFS